MSLNLPDINAVSPDSPNHISFLDFHLEELVNLYNATCDEYEALVESGMRDPDDPNTIYFEDDDEETPARLAKLEGDAAEIAVAMHDFTEAALKYVTVEAVHDPGEPPEQFIKIFMHNTDGYFDFARLDVLMGAMYADSRFEGIESVEDLKSERGLELLLADNPEESVFLVTTPVKHTPVDELLLHTAYTMREMIMEQYPPLREIVHSMGPKALMCKVQEAVLQEMADGAVIESIQVYGDSQQLQPPFDPSLN